MGSKWKMIKTVFSTPFYLLGLAVSLLEFWLQSPRYRGLSNSTFKAFMMDLSD